MTKKIRKLSLKEMEPIAREATRSALKNYVWGKRKNEKSDAWFRF